MSKSKRRNQLPKKNNRKKSPHSLSLRAKLLFTLGLLFVTIPILFYTNQTIQLAYFSPKDVPVVSKSTPVPVNVLIPGLGIDLPVKQTLITNNVWEIASDGASHLATSANPGEKGPIILYGHNTQNRFGNIKKIKEGSEVTLKTADGKIHTYITIETAVTNPDQVSVFFSRKNETLFLYTCYGFADLKRFIVIAVPKR